MPATNSTQPAGSLFPQPPARPPQPPRSSSTVKWLVIGAIVLGVPVFALCTAATYVVTFGPDTKVLPGRQVPARFLAEIRRLELLEPGEQIQYFYSDALVNVENGLYLLTDRRVILYSSDLDEPAIHIPFSDISDVEIDYSGSWVDDSLITLTLVDDSVVFFPVSMEGGGDKKLYEALMKSWEAERP